MEHPGTAPASSQSEDSALSRPLCVNLDGSLVRTDTLAESLLQLLRRRPWLILLLPLWTLGGWARVKRAVSERVSLSAATLPYRTELVEMLRASAAKGRRIVLSTAADDRLAHAVAEHLALFDEVVTSHAGPNRKIVQTRELLEARFGSMGFDYVGSAAADLPVLAAAQRGYLVGASRSTASRARLLGSKVEVLSTRPSRRKAMLKALRPHQWAKNALVVVPVLLAPGLPTFRQLVAAGLAAIAFSLCASAGYVFNDLMDVEADRAHRTKRLRPFASGDLPVLYGPSLFLALLVGSFGLALATLPRGFLAMLVAYFVATLAYSLVFKSKLMVDVVVLAWLYTHRVLSGGIATGIPISTWLLAFSMFIFLSLAFAKRYIELRQSTNKGGQLKSRGYHTQDLEMLASMGPTAGYLAVLVFCFYIDSDVVTSRYHAPVLLWFASPVLLYWISRIWFLAHRGLMQDDPVKFALTDLRSWLSALLVALVAVTARFWPR